MVDKNDILQLIDKTFKETEGNQSYIQEINEEVIYFDKPITGFSSASDPIYDTYKDPQIIGPRYMTPREWMPQARTVISVIMPFTEQIRVSTRQCPREPSIQWLYSRVEGHAFMQHFMRNLAGRLREKDILCIIPTEDERYARYPREYPCGDQLNRHMEINWSERHAAFAAGLGTFGLSRCLITSRGTAMRTISCIINKEIEPSPRPYQDYMEYCTRCGACISRCPVDAISYEYSKNNIKCADWNGYLKEKFKPRYGCANCMTAVPCESCMPGSGRA